MGVVVWPMIELEADDALASAAYLAAKNKRVQDCTAVILDRDLRADALRVTAGTPTEFRCRTALHRCASSSGGSGC